MWLTKAYKANGQLEEAIALCQQLSTSEHQIAQIWGIAFAILMVIKIGWALLILLWIFSLIMPIIAIIQCVQKPDKPVRYPFISHLF